MKYFTAVLALAAGVSANYGYPSNDTTPTTYYSTTPAPYPTDAYPTDKVISYTTEIVSEVTTYCPGPTTITHGEYTYTVTESSYYLTISDCPCTVTKPVYPTTYTHCENCNGTKSEPTTSCDTTTGAAYPTGSAAPTYKPGSGPVTAGAAQVVASGAGLLAILGFAVML